MRIAVFASILGALAGAGATWLALRPSRPQDSAPAGHEEPEVEQRTIWTDRHEIFLENPLLVAGEEAKFVTHVTDLASLEPRREGPITYVLRRGDEGPIEKTVPQPDRPGIYVPTLTFPAADDWKITLKVGEEAIDLGKFEVHASRDEAHAHSHGPEGAITFLKEQQWKLLTRTQPVGRRTLVRRLRVPGVVTARPGSRSALTAPVEGRLLAPPGGKLPAVGDRVEAGQVLAIIQPPMSDFLSKLVEAEADIVRTQVALEQAEATAARLQKLVAEKARPERELLDAEFARRTARANHEAAKSLRAAYAKSGAVLAAGDLPAFEMRSPLAGTVIRVAAAAGENVHTESPVFTILDPSRVWVEARISESNLGLLGGSRAALIETPDVPGRFLPAGDAPATQSPEIDPVTRTSAVIYDVANDAGFLRIGMSLTVHIETARAEEGLSIPESAVVDEEGRFVAFVQVGGESFQKRDLALGIRDAGHAQVISGLSEGERVVTKGAYALRLASVSTSIPAHGHEH